MGVRQPDKIEVFHSGGVFDQFERMTLVNDLAGPSEATFEMGDDGAPSDLAEIIAPGSQVLIFLNDKDRLQGRLEVSGVPISAGGGARIRLTARTRLADARYGSADPKTKIKNTSIKDFVISLYEQVGIGSDFVVFEPWAERDLMTGKGGPTGPAVDLEPIKEDQAKVQPPETVFDAIERHLRRHRATQWDGTGGRIVVGRPDDEQEPRYKLQLHRFGEASRANNILSISKIRDWSEVAHEIHVYGGSPGRSTAKAGIKGIAIDADVLAVVGQDLHFSRVAMMPDQQIKTQQQADQRAVRELSSRSRRKDAYDVAVDGWSYWNGHEQIPWAVNTTVDLHVETLGGPMGKFLIHRTSCEMSAGGALTTKLSLAAPGIWII